MVAARLDIDPFSDEFLADPRPHHETLRDAGAVVWLERHGVWGMARHGDVRATLRDHQTFSSAAGVGLADFRKEPPWRPPSLVLEADPPLHDRTRGVLNQVLSAGAIKRLRPDFERSARRLVGRLLEQREVDAVGDLAIAYPLEVFGDAMGLPKAGRENLLPYGDMAFNAFGPRNARFERSFANAESVSAWIGEHCRREALAPEGLGADIYRHADAGAVSDEEAALLVRSLLTAGLDTTVYALGATVAGFLDFPHQWQLLRREPGRARAAFEEALRYESPVQTFFRTTTCRHEVAGTVLEADQKVLLFLAAANRDPRAWRAPDRFDITRRAAGHVALGAGIHMCVGQMLARLEAEVLLTELAGRVAAIEPNGERELAINNTLRGFSALPVRLAA